MRNISRVALDSRRFHLGCVVEVHQIRATIAECWSYLFQTLIVCSNLQTPCSLLLDIIQVQYKITVYLLMFQMILASLV